MQRVPLGSPQGVQGRLDQLEHLAYCLTRRQRRRLLFRRWRAAVNLIVFVLELQKRTWLRVSGWVTEWYRTSRELVSFVLQVAWANADDHRERAIALCQRRRHLQESQPRSVDIYHFAVFTRDGALLWDWRERYTARLEAADVTTAPADT